LLTTLYKHYYLTICEAQKNLTRKDTVRRSYRRRALFTRGLQGRSQEDSSGLYDLARQRACHYHRWMPRIIPLLFRLKRLQCRITPASRSPAHTHPPFQCSSHVGLAPADHPLHG
jgi:hypothetical protein